MEIDGAKAGRSGAVTVVQRTSADLKLNPHLHSVLLDGVFVAGPDGGDGKPVFHTLPRISTRPSPTCSIIRTRVMRFLVRRRVVEADPICFPTTLPSVIRRSRNWPQPRFRDCRRRVPSCAENR
jgi:hypothetical protein